MEWFWSVVFGCVLTIVNKRAEQGDSEAQVIIY